MENTPPPPPANHEYGLEERMRCAPCWSQGSSHQCVITQEQDEQRCERCKDQNEECLFVLQPRNVMVLRGQVTYQQLVRCSEDEILDLAGVPEVDSKAATDSGASISTASVTSAERAVIEREEEKSTEIGLDLAKSKVKIRDESFIDDDAAGSRPRKRRRWVMEDETI